MKTEIDKSDTSHGGPGLTPQAASRHQDFKPSALAIWSVAERAQTGLHPSETNSTPLPALINCAGLPKVRSVPAKSPRELL